MAGTRGRAPRRRARSGRRGEGSATRSARPRGDEVGDAARPRSAERGRREPRAHLADIATRPSPPRRAGSPRLGEPRSAARPSRRVAGPATEADWAGARPADTSSLASWSFASVMASQLRRQPLKALGQHGGPDAGVVPAARHHVRVDERRRSGHLHHGGDRADGAGVLLARREEQVDMGMPLSDQRRYVLTGQLREGGGERAEVPGDADPGAEQLRVLDRQLRGAEPARGVPHRAPRSPRRAACGSST